MKLLVKNASDFFRNPERWKPSARNEKPFHLAESVSLPSSELFNIWRNFFARRLGPDEKCDNANLNIKDVGVRT